MKSDERRNRGLDLEKTETEIAVAHGSHRGGNLHGAGGLSRGVNFVGVEVTRLILEKKLETPHVVFYEFTPLFADARPQIFFQTGEGFFKGVVILPVGKIGDVIFADFFR